MKYKLGDHVIWQTAARNSEKGISTILLIDEQDPHPYAVLKAGGEWLYLSEDEILKVI